MTEDQIKEMIRILIGLHAETGYGSTEEFLQKTLGPNPDKPDGSWYY